MPFISKESFLKYLNNIETIIAEGHIHRLRPFDPERGSLVTNLLKLPVSKFNFGTGEADFIFPLTIENNSTGILAFKGNYILRLVW